MSKKQKLSPTVTTSQTQPQAKPVSAEKKPIASSASSTKEKRVVESSTDLSSLQGKCTLFVRNLPFATTNESLSAFFSEVGPLRSCFVVKKGKAEKEALDNSKESQPPSDLSKGYGFVHYASADDAQTALQTLANKKFEGRLLRIELAIRKNALKRVAQKMEQTQGIERGKDEKDRDSNAEPKSDEAEKHRKINLIKAKDLVERLKSKTLPKPVIQLNNQPTKAVLISGLDAAIIDRKQLFKKCRKFGLPVSLDYPYGPSSQQALVQYASAKEAMNALRHLDKHTFKGCTMSVEYDHPVKSKNKKQPKEFMKNFRLIVRNLPFKITEDEITEAFSKHGKLLEVKLPRKTNGGPRGFAFIQYEKSNEAESALRTLHGSTLKGRMIAIDYALQKDQYEQELKVQNLEQAIEQELKGPTMDKEAHETRAHSGDNKKRKHEESTLAMETRSISASEDEDEEQEQEQEREQEQEQEEYEEEREREAEENDPISSDEHSESEMSDVIHDERDMFSDNDEQGEELMDEHFSQHDDEDDDEDDDGDEDDDEDESDASLARHSSTHSDSLPSKSVYSPEEELERTLFVRSLHYETTVDELKEKFATFGPIQYVKLVYDPSGRPRGSAFVCYQKRADMEQCLDDYAATAKPASFMDEAFEAMKEAEESKSNPQDAKELSSGKKHPMSSKAPLLTQQMTELPSAWVLRGRWIELFPSMAKTSAQALVEKRLSERKAQDKRNLYLAKEGIILAHMPEAKDMSPSDAHKRAKSAQARALQLKNVNFFVSPLRLSIRNLPLSMDEKTLKAKCLAAIAEAPAATESKGAKHPLIRQVKIMRSKERKDASGAWRSMGYAFVEFADHEHALACLRHMNNHPTLFTAQRRPIVEFAIENSSVVLARKERQQNVAKKEPSSQAQPQSQRKPSADSRPLKTTTKRVGRFADKKRTKRR